MRREELESMNKKIELLKKSYQLLRLNLKEKQISSILIIMHLSLMKKKLRANLTVIVNQRQKKMNLLEMKNHPQKNRRVIEDHTCLELIKSNLRNVMIHARNILFIGLMLPVLVITCLILAQLNVSICIENLQIMKKINYQYSISQCTMLQVATKLYYEVQSVRRDVIILLGKF